jgi:hypothetical protein
VTEAGSILRWVLAYGLWLVSGALSLVATLYLRLFLLIDLPINVLGANRYTQRAADRFGTVLFGLAWLIFAVASESYFRRIIDGELSAKQVAAVFAIELLLLGIAVGGHLLIG